jgi:hypothetical protein
MPAGVNVPVLIGSLPLLHVQSMTLSEGYRIERVAGSKFSQAVGPTAKRITIEAMLLGPERLMMKKALETMALTSRLLVAMAAPGLKASGLPVVSGMTVSLDMQITDLRFVQSISKREALDVSITLEHVPRASLTAILGEVADLALAAGSLAIPTGPGPNPISRTPR